ncbi:MAG: Dabb family protein [Ahrensia sp.]
MIKHIVLFKPAEHADADDISAVLAGLATLSDKLEGASQFRAGACLTEDPVSRGYSRGFTIEFEGPQALQTYLDHPTHKQLGAQLLAVTQGGIEGLLVMDLKCPD